ncbi:MAG TPA: hypothetical protein DEA26_05095 [Oceanospirillales bacterium]|nr:hypothetical protein [Oceanospirillaceae bacterium]HBS42035.1 hypothetical protein [Oceanospirillales bacterium]|tara:strand:+ start:25744 stop:25971 length:228 start_codon:yes stop_codon:yes gene_type:complete
MAKYMTQSMSSGILTKITYYRKQSGSHPSHAESGRFTQDAIDDYAQTNGIDESEVDEGTYRSNQGVPGGMNTKEI